MREKRRLNRKKLFFYLPVINKDTNEKIGSLINLHQKGLLLTSEKNISIGNNFNIIIKIPENIEHNNDIEAAVISRWSNTSPNPSFYDTGFEFIQLNHDNIFLINLLMSRIGF